MSGSNIESRSNKRPDSEMLALFFRVWAAFGIALFVSTWKLWTPQVVFPQIPVFEFATSASPTIDWVAFTSILVSLVLVAAFHDQSPVRQGAVVVFAISLIALFVMNQHRLQPWTWHWFVFAVIFASTKASHSIRWLRWVVASIYIYSAISKLDYQFVHSVGLEMLHASVNLIGLSLDDWSHELATRVVLLLPLVELVTGFGLALSATRSFFGWIAIVLHGMLLLILGPFGLNHQSPVLIWNAFFMFQSYWLFVRNKSIEEADLQDSFRSWPAAVFSLFVVTFPATCSFGGCDHWLAWELYAPRSSRVEIQLQSRNVSQLPQPAINYATQDRPFPGAAQIDLARWSLNELNVPVYPQARFQFGVARALGELVGDENASRIVIRGRSDRWSGERASHEIRGPGEILRQAETYWLSTRPRSLTSRADR